MFSLHPTTWEFLVEFAQNNDETMKQLAFIITMFILMVFSLIMLKRYNTEQVPKAKAEQVTADTIVSIDTIRITDTRVISTEVVRMDTLILHTSDTIRDSVRVVMPVEHVVCTDDSTYRAWVTGISPSLDSIEVYPRTIEVVKPQHTKPKRWGIGVQTGVGYTDKITPYIGIGVTYNIINL